MSKIIVRGDVVINVYVNSPEQVNEVTESAKSLAEILKGKLS